MILMYHHVIPADKVPSGRPDEGWNLTISPQGLRNHIQALRGQGKKFVSLDEMVAVIERQGYAPASLAAITLDDGWLDNYEQAFPVFRELGVPATFFVTTGHLSRGPHDPRRMTVSQLRELRAKGMTIGAHSRSHPALSRLATEAAREEIRGSKRDLEDALGEEVAHFAYPGGDFNRQTADITHEAGYKSACSVVGLGVNTRATLFWLHREVLTEPMDTFRDRCSISFSARLLLTPRARRALRRRLQT